MEQNTHNHDQDQIEASEEDFPDKAGLTIFLALACIAYLTIYHPIVIAVGIFTLLFGYGLTKIETERRIPPNI